MPELQSIQRELFCNEYLVDLCGAAAARRAKYKASRSKQTAWELLRDPEIRGRIKELISEREENSPVRAYRVLEELAAIACSNIDHYHVRPDGRVVIAKGAPNRAMAAVKSVRRKVRTIPQDPAPDGTKRDPIIEHDVELTLYDKNPAMAKYLEHVGLIRPAGLDVNVKIGVTAVVELTPAERLARLQRFGLPVQALPPAPTDASRN